MTDYPGLGTDIELDSDGNFALGASGDLMLVAGEACLLQGVQHRLITPLGNLFYDVLFGLDIYRYLHGDDTDLARFEFCEAVKDQLQLEPRIRQGSESCEVLDWTDETIRLQVSFTHIKGTTPTNLVLNANLTDMSVVIEGVNNG